MKVAICYFVGQQRSKTGFSFCWRGWVTFAEAFIEAHVRNGIGPCCSRRCVSGSSGLALEAHTALTLRHFGSQFPVRSCCPIIFNGVLKRTRRIDAASPACVTSGPSVPRHFQEARAFNLRVTLPAAAAAFVQRS